MKNAIKRLDEYLRYKHLSDYRATKLCNLSVGMLSKARKGETNLGSETIERILKTFSDLNPVWLLIGEGEMLQTSPSVSIVQNDNTIQGSNNNNINVGAARELEKEITYLQEIIRQKEELLSEKERTIKILINNNE